MTATTFRIDPTLPLCWENAHTLRFGFDRAEVRLHNPSAKAQRFIDLLRKGFPSRDLILVSNKVGLTVRERRELLDALAPILSHKPINEATQPKARGTVSVLGSGPLARYLEVALEQAGFTKAQGNETPSFAVLIERYLEPATKAHSLLMKDVPHLSLRTSDRSASLGPLVPPGGAPCLACAELHSLQTNPLAPVLAAQLYLDAPLVGAPSCMQALAALTVSAIESWQQGRYELVGTRLHFSMQNGLLSLVPTVEQISPHPKCGCVSLGETQLMAA